MSSKNTKPTFWWGIGIGALLALPVIGVSSAANALFRLPLIPSDVMDTLPNVLPVDLLNLGKQVMIDVLTALNPERLDTVAKTAELIIGTVTLLVVCAVVMGLAYHLASRSTDAKAGMNYPLAGGLFIAALMSLIHIGLPAVQFSRTGGAIFFDIAFIVAVFAGFGYAAGWVYQRLSAPTSTPSGASPSQAAELDRRQFLVRVGGSAAVLTVTGAVVGLVGAGGESSEALPDIDPALTSVESAPTPAPVAQTVAASYDENFEPATGTRPEYTPLERHYRIDIVQNPPEIDAVAWRLPVIGLVENPVEWTLDELRAMPAVSQIVTMSCISNNIGGSLISTTKWTGIPMSHLLEQVKPTADAQALKITCADGFDEYVRIELLQSDPRIMLAYAWDDRPLLQKHGFPVRIHIPDLYGMKQPKWITQFEFVSRWDEGYWVRRGWSPTARVQSTAVIDTVASSATFERDGKTFVPLGGIAYAGARGISQVEVKVDDGEWQLATLKAPQSDRTWLLWRYDWEFVAGAHTFVVRCVDGTGQPQIEAQTPVRPDGATGYHQKFQNV